MKQLSRQSALVFEDFGHGLADAQELEGIIPFLGRQCLGKDIRSLLSCLNVLDAIPLPGASGSEMQPRFTFWVLLTCLSFGEYPFLTARM